MRFGSFDFVTFIKDVLCLCVCVCVCVCDVTKLPNVFSAQKVSKKFISPNMQLSLLMRVFRTDVWLTAWKMQLVK